METRYKMRIENVPMFLSEFKSKARQSLLLVTRMKLDCENQA